MPGPYYLAGSVVDLRDRGRLHFYLATYTYCIRTHLVAQNTSIDDSDTIHLEGLKQDTMIRIYLERIKEHYYITGLPTVWSWPNTTRRSIAPRSYDGRKFSSAPNIKR